MDNLEIVDLSPTPIFITKIDKFDKKIILEKIKNLEYVSTDNTNPNSSWTTKTVNLFDDVNLKDLHSCIMQKFYDISKNVFMYDEQKFKITTSWVLKTLPGQCVEGFHRHTNCMYSGVFYVDVNEISGDIFFTNPLPNDFQVKFSKSNKYNTFNYRILPECGMLIFFPAGLVHRIFKNESNMIRYSISFNILPTGKTGINQSVAYF